MTTTLSSGYPSNANALACSLGGLASSTTAGRSCVAWDNTITKYPDVGMTIRVKTNGSAPTGEKGVYIYPYISIDATNFSGSSAEAVGGNTSVTLESPTALLGPFFLPTPQANTTYQYDIPSFKALTGGEFCPQKGGAVINNQSGNALSSTAGDHTVTWTASQPTSA